MNKKHNLEELSKEELIQMIKNQEKRIKRQSEVIIPDNIESHNRICVLKSRIDKAIEYIKENEKEYGSLEENEKIILDILRGKDNE